MSRHALTLGLLLSVGVNLGVLGAIAAGRFADRGASGTAPEGAEELSPAAEHAAARLDGETAQGLDEPTEAGPAGDEPADDGPVGIDGPVLDAPATGTPSAEDGPEIGGPPEPGPGVGADPARHRPPEAGPAGRDRPGPGAGRWASGLPGAPPIERLADRLGLEGETRERFLAVQRRWFESLLATRRERYRLTVELRRELAAARPDRARIGDLVERLGEAYAAEEAATAGAVLDSRALLDPGQQETYGRFLRHLAERDGGRRGPRGGGRPFGRHGPPG